MYRGCVLTGIVWMGLLGAVPLQTPAAESPVDTEKITKEARETLEATKQYTARQKEVFQRKAQEEFEAIQRQMTLLRTKAHEASAGARADLERSLKELDRKKEAVRKQLDEFKTAQDSALEGIQMKVRKALSELQESFARVRGQLP